MEQEKLDEALTKLKMLLGIKDSGSDDLLFFLISDTVDMILGYCHIDVLPRQLESLVTTIAADCYRVKGYGQAEAPQTVKAISEGERSVTYDNGASENDFLEKYYKRLKPFRNLRGKVPSDVS